MNYENLKHKISNLYTQEVANQNDLNKVDAETKRIQANARAYQSTLTTKKVFYSYATEFEDMEEFSVAAYGTSELNLYKEWRIELPNLPIKFLPFIIVNIFVENNPSLNLIASNIRHGYCCQCSNITEDNILENPVIVAGITVPGLSTYFPMKSRIELVIYNPEEFM